MKVTEVTGLGKKVYLNRSNLEPIIPIYNVKINTDQGEIDLKDYKGTKILIVNLASKCGFTPQYESLERLNREYKDTLKVLGFPSNSFANQEPDDDETIASFCKLNYGVTFRLFPKKDVIGRNTQPVYEWLTNAEKNGWNDHKPVWNFYKYLIDETGRLKGVYSSAVSPYSQEILKAIEK